MAAAASTSAAGEEDPGAALDVLARSHVVQPLPDTVPQPVESPPAPPDETPDAIPAEIEPPPADERSPIADAETAAGGRPS